MPARRKKKKGPSAAANDGTAKNLSVSEKAYPIAVSPAMLAAGVDLAAAIDRAERGALASLWLHPNETVNALLANGVQHPRMFTAGVRRELARLLSVAREPLSISAIVGILRNGGTDTHFAEVAELLSEPCGVAAVPTLARLLRSSARLQRLVAGWYRAAVDVGGFGRSRQSAPAAAARVPRFVRVWRKGARA